MPTKKTHQPQQKQATRADLRHFYQLSHAPSLVVAAADGSRDRVGAAIALAGEIFDRLVPEEKTDGS